MALSDEFEQAQVRVKQLTKLPSSEELLELYALYKQSTAGNAGGDRPGMMDLRGRAKYDAWAKHKGMTKDAAMQAYIDLVAKHVK